MSNFNTLEKIALKDQVDHFVFLRKLEMANYPDVEFEIGGLEDAKQAYECALYLKDREYKGDVCLRWKGKKRVATFIVEEEPAAKDRKRPRQSQHQDRKQ